MWLIIKDELRLGLNLSLPPTNSQTIMARAFHAPQLHKGMGIIMTSLAEYSHMVKYSQVTRILVKEMEEKKGGGEIIRTLIEYKIN